MAGQDENSFRLGEKGIEFVNVVELLVTDVAFGKSVQLEKRGSAVFKGEKGGTHCFKGLSRDAASAQMRGTRDLTMEVVTGVETPNGSDRMTNVVEDENDGPFGTETRGLIPHKTQVLARMLSRDDGIVSTGPNLG